MPTLTNQPNRAAQPDRARHSRARPTTATDAAGRPRNGAKRQLKFYPGKADRRKALAASGLEIHKIALRLGVCDGSIRRWICRGCDSLSRARQMSRILDCPINYFLWR